MTKTNKQKKKTRFRGKLKMLYSMWMFFLEANLTRKWILNGMNSFSLIVCCGAFLHKQGQSQWIEVPRLDVQQPLAYFCPPEDQ